MMNILEYDFKQRAYDSKWERLAKIMDEENAYVYKTESGTPVSIIPTRWITVGVFDYLFDLEETI